MRKGKGRRGGGLDGMMGGGVRIAAENRDGEGRAKGYAWFRSRSPSKS